MDVLFKETSVLLLSDEIFSCKMFIPTQATSMHVAIYGSLCKSRGQYGGQSQLRWSYEECVCSWNVSPCLGFTVGEQYGRAVDDLLPE